MAPVLTRVTGSTVRKSFLTVDPVTLVSTGRAAGEVR